VTATSPPDAQRKAEAALKSVAASAGLTALKLAAGLASGSLALLSEGAHNALDIAASALTYFAVRYADKPADDEHPFGHAKAEAVAALAQTALLAALALGVAALAVPRLFAPAPLRAGGFAIAVVIVSLAVDAWRWRTLSRTARETGSDALAADALHYAGDFVGAGLVLAGLLASRLGFPGADAFAALGVAVFIGVSACRLALRTVDSLLDAAPAGLADDVRRALGGMAGVEGVDYLRLRRVGAGAAGELGLFVARRLSLEGVDALRGRVTEALARRWPRLKLTIAATSRALDDETVLERVMLIAARRRQFVHHVTIQRADGRIAVSLDLEVDGRMTLGRAHDVADELEKAISAEFEGTVEVDTHIEPMETREIAGEDADPALTAQVEACLARRIASLKLLSDLHHVRLRVGGAGIYGVFHCRADRDAPIDAVHAEVDALERCARETFPGIARIIGHAEPFQRAYLGD
jgi:cation diffusion facilitator family transporter